VEEQQLRPVARYLDVQPQPAVPHLDRLVAHGGRRHAAPSIAAARGHQWFSQPSASQSGRSRGSTSPANSEMFFSVRSRGIEPFRSITSRLRILNSRTNASIWSATVAGLPTIATWLSTISA